MAGSRAACRLAAVHLPETRRAKIRRCECGDLSLLARAGRFRRRIRSHKAAVPFLSSKAHHISTFHQQRRLHRCARSGWSRSALHEKLLHFLIPERALGQILAAPIVSNRTQRA